MQRVYPLRRHLLATASFSAASLFLSPLFNHTAHAGALPSGGQYVAGKGAIGGNSGSLVVRQSSTAGIIDWNSFSIGKGNSVTFDNGSGATLNEVTGGNLSTIAGSLHASGSVFLINQAGVIVSGSGRIVTGGSFGVSTGNDSKRGDIVAAGKIQSLHGNVNLSGANVSVPGSIAVMRGGHLWLTSSGTTSIAGALNVDNRLGAGGTIVATGKTVDVSGTANISASGANKGGTILLGGDIHGGAIAADNFITSSVADAQTTKIAKGAHITANASQGAGGDIVIWSDGHTSFDGAISAKGATAGGFAEVSSHDLLAFDGAANLTAQDGKTGTLLLDPENVTIESGTTTGGALNGGSPTNTFTPSADNSILSVSDLESALASANVTVTTGSTGSQAGNITVASGFTWSAHTLTLDAYGSIYVDAHVKATGTAGLSLIDADTTSTGVNDGNAADGDLYFINGRISFASTSEALSINGNAYTLVNDVAALAAAVGGNASGYYALSDNYDAAQDGTYTQSPVTTAFTGTFEGLGNTITNLSIDGSETNLELGLFSEIWGTVRDLNLSNVDIVANGTASVAAGALAGGTVGDAIIENVGVSGSVTASGGSGISGGNAVGGLVGYTNGGELLNDHSSVTVADGGSSASQPVVGGLVGNNAATITNSYASGSVVTGSGIAYVGGFVGIETSGTISNSGATGSVSSSANSYTGGFVGYVDSGATIQTSYATGTVTSTASGSGVGGFAGANNGAINRSYSTGSATDTVGSGVGGFAGFNFDGTINESYSSGQVSSAAGSAGGFVGQNENTGVIAPSENDYYNSTANPGAAIGSDSGTDTSQVVIGLSSSALHTASSFTGWTFGTSGGGSGWVIVDQDGSLNNFNGIAGGTSPMLEAEYSTTITNAHQLQLMALNLGATYTIGNDIDASGTAGNDVWGSNGFIPVGNDSSGTSTTQFFGTLNGSGHTITGLIIFDTVPIGNQTAFEGGSYEGEGVNVGLFGYIATGGTVTGVNLVGGVISGTSVVGALAGQNAGTITNASSSAQVNGIDTFGDGSGASGIGGLVGLNTNLINQSSASGAVSGLVNVGGLVGSNSTNGSVAPTIENSFATGTVTGLGGSDLLIGGLVGQSATTTTGIAADLAPVLLNDYATGSVSGNFLVGGLVGDANSGTITNSYASGTVTGTGAFSSDIGGLVGFIGDQGAIGTVVTTSSASGAVSGSEEVGGLVGTMRGGDTISYSVATGSVSATDPNDGFNVGGLVGFAIGTISNSYATGAVTGNVNVGGLVGELTIVANSSNTIFNNSAGSITDSYSLGKVTEGPAPVGPLGALVGAVVSGTETNGTTPLNPTITGAYFNSTNNGSTVGVGSGPSGGVAGLTTTQMESASSFSTWTFGTTPGGSGWVIVDSDGTLNNASGAAGATTPMLLSEYSTTITNAHQLQLMALDLSADYTLANDIDATATGTGKDVWGAGGFAAIGGNNAGPFTGDLNGENYVINGLTVVNTSQSNAGLFGELGGTVEYLGLTNVNISTSAGEGVSPGAGALAGVSYGSIDYVYATGTVTATQADDNNTYAGGLVGFLDYGTIDNSHAAVTVMAGAGSGIGGLAGIDFAGGTVENSYATGSATGGDNASTGGLIGYVYEAATISNVFATGAVSGGNSANVGGLIGEALAGTISDSHASGTVSGGGNGVYGGFIGEDGAAITQSYASGTVSKSDSATGGDFGGFAGGVDQYGSIAKSYATGAVTVDGTSTAGGFVGSNGGMIEEAYSKGKVTGGMTGQVGGFAGDNVMAGVIGDVTEVYYETTGNTGLSGVGTNTGVSVNIGGIADMTNPTNFTAWSDFGGLGSGQVWVTIGADGSVDGTGGTTPMLLSEYSTTIMSAHQLQLMELDPTASYSLGRNIDASGTAGGNVWGANGFIAIGGNNAPSDFAGSLDGESHTISNLTIDDSTNASVGLIGVMDEGATIANLTLSNVSIQSSSATALGGAVGSNYGTVMDVSVSGTVSGSNAQVSVGGIAGYNDGGAISGSQSAANVSATNDGSGQGAGGLVGFNNVSGSISQSSATGSVSMNGDDVTDGGLVGVNGGSISQSFATGAVVLTDSTQNSGNTGGGLVGTNDGGSIVQSYAMGSVTMSGGAGSFGGGLAGDNINSGTIQNSYSLGKVTASFAGGLVGEDQIPGGITGSYWDTQTSGITSLTQGAGTTSNDTGITGETTTQLQAALPASFVGSAWSIVAGTSFPYLTWQFFGTPEVIAGKALNTYGGTGASGVSVYAIAGGDPLSSALTGGAVTTFADGYYYYLLSPGTLPTNGSGSVLVYRTGTGGGAFEDNLSNGSAGSLDIYGDYMHIITNASTYTTVQSPELSGTIGQDTAVETILQGLGNLAIDAGGLASGTFDIDSPITVTGNLVLTSENGTTIGQSAAITSAGLLLEGNGAFTLTNSGNAFTTLAGNITSAHVFDSSALTVGSVAGVSGLESSGAVTLGDSSSLTLADSVLAGTNTLTLDAGTTIAQSGGVIAAGTLTGSSSGAVTLTDANVIADLGAFTTGNGAFSLTDVLALALHGALNAGTGNVTLKTTGSGHTLTLDAAVKGVTVDLVSASTIASDSAGIITATTLEGSSDGAAMLTAANDIAKLGAFTTGNGELSLTDQASLTVDGAVNAGTGNLVLKTAGTGHKLTLDAAAKGATVDLVSAGTITSDSAGIITASVLAGSSDGAVSLMAANAIGVLGTFTTTNADFSLNSEDSLSVNGAINAGTGTLMLSTAGAGHGLAIEAVLKGATIDLVSADAITSDSAGVITATKLTGSSNGPVALTAANVVGDLDTFTTGSGSFAFTDAANLTVDGLLAGAGNLTLTTTGAGHSLDVDAGLHFATVDLVSAGTIASNSGGVITAQVLKGSSVGGTTLVAANAIADLDAFTTDNGAFSLADNGALIVDGALDAGTGDVTLKTTGSLKALTLDAEVKGATVDLVSSGEITSDSGGAVVASKLLGSSGGLVELTSANSVGVLGAFTTDNASFSLTDAAALVVSGAVDAGTGNLTLRTTGAGHALTLDDSLKGAAVDLVSASTIASNSAGVITATELTGSSDGAVTLAAANAVADLDAFTTENGAFSLTDADSLTVKGAVDAGSGDLTLTTTGSGHNLAIDAHVTGKTVDFTSSGDVTESSAGAVLANLLNVTADTGISLTSSANDITTVGTDHTNSGSNTIDKH